MVYYESFIRRLMHSSLTANSEAERKNQMVATVEQLREIITRRETKNLIRQDLIEFFKIARLSTAVAENLAEKTIELTSSMPSHAVEKEIRKYLENIYDNGGGTSLRNVSVLEKTKQSFSGRASTLAALLEEHIKGHRILDIGGGNGYLAQEISKKFNKEVDIVDTINYAMTNLPFFVYDGHSLPFKDKKFDTSLLIAVLHHSNTPTEILSEARRVSKRIVIIETTYGGENKKSKDINLAKTIFFDWFYNRVLLNENIDTPFNFRTVREWLTLFKEHELKLIDSRSLGRSFKSIFLKHHLFVLEP